MRVQTPAATPALAYGKRPRIPLSTIALAAAGCALLTYVVVCAVTWEWQRELIFEPDTTLQKSPSDFPFAITEVAIPVSSAGEAAHTIHGWWIPSARAGAKTVLYLHGNDGNVSTSMDGVAPLRELGYSVFMIDYRGYGKSDGGFPSESGVYEDAEAAWNYLRNTRGIAQRDLFIYGHSLGGAIAIELAVRHPEAAGLVVESSFTSIMDMATQDWKYSVLPVNLMLNQRFDSIEKVAQLKLPVLYLHGTADEVVPFEMGEQLYRNSGGAKEFVAINGGNHDNNALVDGPALRAAVGRFVENSAGLREGGAPSNGALFAR